MRPHYRSTLRDVPPVFRHYFFSMLSCSTPARRPDVIRRRRARPRILSVLRGRGHTTRRHRAGRAHEASGLITAHWPRLTAHRPARLLSSGAFSHQLEAARPHGQLPPSTSLRRRRRLSSAPAPADAASASEPIAIITPSIASRQPRPVPLAGDAHAALYFATRPAPARRVYAARRVLIFLGDFTNWAFFSTSI